MSTGMLSTGLISTLPGTIHTRQSLTFRAPMKVIGEITGLNLPRKSATLRTRCLVKEDVVIEGEACVLVPSRP
jgi:3-hydroxybutyryl-CoA dehydratase